MQVQTSGQFGGLGIEVTEDNGFIKVVSPIDDTPAARAGVKAGDLILMLDGKSVQGLSLNDAVDQMRGAPNSTIRLTLKRDGVEKPIELTMQREVIKVQVVKSRLDGDVGYIRLSQFTEQSDSGVRHAIDQLKQQSGDKLKGYVLDLRNNPGGLLDQAVAVSNDFLNQGEIVSTKARHPEDSQRWDAKSGGDLINGLPLVVLINGGAASASEIVSGALQDHRRAVLVGTRSFGKGSVQTVIPLPGNGAMRLTTARYYTPSGRSIQGLGITPDIEVHETRTDEAHFGPEREADLNHTLTNVGGTPQSSLTPRTDLPPIATQIAKLPPASFPSFDPSKPETDYQLQEAELVVHALATQKRAGVP
jgi:carboxyl-terminal processing protease